MLWHARRVEADDLLSQTQLGTQSTLYAQHAFRACWRRQCVNVYDVMTRTKAAHTSDALLESGGIPRQVEVHDDRGPLEIEALAEDIGGDEEPDMLGGRG